MWFLIYFVIATIVLGFGLGVQGDKLDYDGLAAAIIVSIFWPLVPLIGIGMILAKSIDKNKKG